MLKMHAIAIVNSSNSCFDSSDAVSSRVVSDIESCLRSLSMKKIELIKLKMELEKT